MPTTIMTTHFERKEGEANGDRVMEWKLVEVEDVKRTKEKDDLKGG